MHYLLFVPSFLLPSVRSVSW